MRLPKSSQRRRRAVKIASIHGRRDQRIAGRAVNDGEKNLGPDRIKRQLDRFPQRMTRGRQAQIEQHDPCGSVSRHPIAYPGYRRTVRRRRALVTTRTELMLIASLAIIGLSNKPIAG
jgi:hypothetical protein